MTINEAISGAYGTSPYADLSEYAPPIPRVKTGKVYSQVHPTDARAVEIFVSPSHVNLIPNPSCYVDDAGWVYSGFNDPATLLYDWTFADAAVGADNAGLLDSIIGGTTSAVEPDPSTTAAYSNGQLVYISGTDVWLEVDDAETLTVAGASALGLDIDADVSGFKAFDPTLASQVYLDLESWVGQALHAVGTGTVHYEDGTHGLVYVGPTNQGQMPQGIISGSDWWEPAKSTDEYTFSVYARGNENTFVQLSVYGYRPRDVAGGDIGPEDEPAAWSHSPAYRMSDQEYERFSVRTTARLDDISEGTVSFADCWWVKVEVTITKDVNSLAPEVWLSSFMLDNTETPCAYFDGSLVEEGRDDFFWVAPVPSDDPMAIPRPWFSAYYYDRLARTSWLYANVYQAVPANRPVHVYFHDRSHPYAPFDPEFTGTPV